MSEHHLEIELLAMTQQTRAKLRALDRETLERLDFDLWSKVLSQPWTVAQFPDRLYAGRMVGPMCVVLSWAVVELAVVEGFATFMLVNFDILHLPCRDHDNPL